MITKEKIAQYCVDSKGSKELAEQIARQFERAGFEKIHFFDTEMPEGNNFVYVYERGRGGYSITACTERSKEQSKLTETTLEALTKMVDELVTDEYSIIWEWVMFNGGIIPDGDFVEKLDAFKQAREKARSKHPVTLQDLKEAYAEKIGIEVDKIVVREETK